MQLYPRESCYGKWDTGTAAQAARGNCYAGEIYAFHALGVVRCTSSPSAQACNFLSLFSDLLLLTPVVKNTDLEIGKPAV